MECSFFGFSSEGNGCTLFGAIGNAVEGGGVLIGKARDRSEPFEQVFVVIQPKEGFRYRGIATQGKSVSSGINEKGLVVVERSRFPCRTQGRKDHFASEDPFDGLLVLRMSFRCCPKGKSRDRSISWWPIGIASVLIEAAGEGHYGTEIIESGVLYHTNHFVLESMKESNPEKVEIRVRRLCYDRIEALMTHGPLYEGGLHCHDPGIISSRTRRSIPSVRHSGREVPEVGSDDFSGRLFSP